MLELGVVETLFLGEAGILHCLVWAEKWLMVASGTGALGKTARM
jgi:hypothetical protein